MDRLISDLIEYLRSNGLGVPADTCKSEGMYIIRSVAIAKALWMILTPCLVDSAHTQCHRISVPLYPWSYVRKNFEEKINNPTDRLYFLRECYLNLTIFSVWPNKETFSWSRVIKHIIVQDLHAMCTREIMTFLSRDSTMETLYPNLSKLCSISLVLPVSTADCKRGFSTLKQIKTVPRNRLSTTTLNRLIQISTEGPNLMNLTLSKKYV